MTPSVETETDKDKAHKVNQAAKYSLKLKSEYVLNERSPTLPPLPIKPKEENETTQTKKRGRNKKRPRDAKPDPSTKICFEYLKNKENGCPFGDGCKYSHDISKIFLTREEDIKVDHEIPCPHYNNFGCCPFSMTCRVGMRHLDEKGNNLKKEADKKEDYYKNVVSKDLLMSLRKHTFPFVQQRNGKKKPKEKLMENFDDASAALPGGSKVDTSAYPAKEMKIIDFRNKVYVAPLTTVGNLPFRRIMKHFQADITCCEMALSTSLLSGVPSEWALLKRHSSEDIFGIQLAGGFPDQYIRVAELLRHQRNENNFTFDFVDMNLGCPLDILCDKGAGARLMTKSNKLKDCVVGMSKVLVDVPFSIKMRTGWDENKPFAKELIEKIIGWDVPNVSTFFVHGRSRLQRYTKLADWEYIESVASSNPSKPVIPNGDILSYTDYYDKLEKYPSLTPCAMLARGALIKPWLPIEIKEKRHYDISSSERFDMLKQFVSFGLEHWGSDAQGVNTTRRFLLEWLSFLYRYVPVGLLEVLPQEMNQRPPVHMCGRDDLETLMLSNHYNDWIKISEMLLGPVPEGFEFTPKHKANSYS